MCSSVDGYLGCFHFSYGKNNAVRSSRARKFPDIYVEDPQVMQIPSVWWKVFYCQDIIKCTSPFNAVFLQLRKVWCRKRKDSHTAGCL